ncbi:biotin synthase [Phlyctochytrium bullatum]|nr:biotin synthase [Phlyctochytrium bullatum]
MSPSTSSSLTAALTRRALRASSRPARLLPAVVASVSAPAARHISTSKPAHLASLEPQVVTAARPAHQTQQPTPKQAVASAAAVAAEASSAGVIRKDWSREEIQAIYDSPLMDLLFYGAQVHRANHNGLAVQQCTLLSIKTGGCSEDCAYCPQSSRYKTEVKAHKLLKEDAVLEAARKAKEAGSSRFCMGAAWRDLNGRKTNFNQILHYVREIKGMGMEVCCTLGMLDEAQAQALAEAGLTAYNHNLDTSREYYPKIITTRSYDERLETIRRVREAGISVCSGGIIGLGEEAKDRVGMLHTLATLPEHPESVPVNALLAVEGTPLAKQEPVQIWDMVRMIATARIVMPKSMVRLSAGRVRFTHPEQALCFMAGANSIFTGDKLLTTPNNAKSDDAKLFELLGIEPLRVAVRSKDGEVIGVAGVRAGEEGVEEEFDVETAPGVPSDCPKKARNRAAAAAAAAEAAKAKASGELKLE